MLPSLEEHSRLQETISLYLDLKPGQKADFEVVGRTAAAFAEAVKEIAFVVEPGLEVKLEFDSGTEGSLSLNALLKDAKQKPDSRIGLLMVIVTVAGWFLSDLRSYGVGKFLDQFLAPEQREQLSDADIERIAKALKNVIDGKTAKEQVQKVYKEIERDEAITHVGTISKPGTKPIDPVPRQLFPERTGVAPPVATTPTRRKKITREKLTLISPVLLAADRLWRFRNGAGDEFGYTIKDVKFLNGLLTGRRRIPMKAGIQITASIDTHEIKEAGVWGCDRALDNRSSQGPSR
jgi:hypothetical protein